ncbi:MAG: TnsA endonuclease N-terminal domain-containing protein [Melioribacter sp.]|nr:TnsA endonuclease N-terminal domain-containing protein [Melioribacter sp.]
MNIEYITQVGNKRGYRPDFLVEKIDGTIEIHEVKGGQFLDNPDTIRKHERAKHWCKQRGINSIVVTKK